MLWTNNTLRGGNHLYQWLLADSLRATSPETYVLGVPNQAAWTQEFPALAGLTLDRHNIRFTDRRLLWPGQRFGVDFSRDQLNQFCTQRLLASDSFLRRLNQQAELGNPSSATINIRRGDYYGTPLEAEFGMRITSYIDAALRIQESIAPINRLQIVSDDPEWCRKALERLSARYPLYFDHHRKGKFDDLAALAASNRLILANSTFSYWGAYLATVRGAEPAHVVAPFFHQVASLGRKPWFHDPEWRVVPSLPDGDWQ